MFGLESSRDSSFPRFTIHAPCESEQPIKYLLLSDAERVVVTELSYDICLMHSIRVSTFPMPGSVPS